jgi:hypothetical protein
MHADEVDTGAATALGRFVFTTIDERIHTRTSTPRVVEIVIDHRYAAEPDRTATKSVTFELRSHGPTPGRLEG